LPGPLLAKERYNFVGEDCSFVFSVHISLLSELLAGFVPLELLLFKILLFDVTNNDPLDFGGRLAIALKQTRSLLLKLPADFTERVLFVEFLGVGGGMHHKLVVLHIVGLGHDVGHHWVVLRQESFIIYFFPFVLLG
jgi:hypothetical protein